MTTIHQTVGSKVAAFLRVDPSSSQPQLHGNIGVVIVDTLKNFADIMSEANKSLLAEMTAFHQRHLSALKDELKINLETSKATKEEKDAMNAKINSIDHHLASLHSDMSAVKTLLEAQHNQKMLDFQISCAELDCFTFYHGYTWEERQSSDLIRHILKRHGLGQLCSISPHFTTMKNSDSERGRKEFRELLGNQLELILRKKLYFQKRSDGRFVIRFS